MINILDTAGLVLGGLIVLGFVVREALDKKRPASPTHGECLECGRCLCCGRFH